MEEMLSKEMKDLITALGALVREDERCKNIEKSIEDYERSEELNSLIAEYNAQQNILADTFAKAEGEDNEAADDARDAVQARIDELYDAITNHEVYTSYLAAKSAFDALSNEIYGELQFAITGKRPCAHDCSCCHSDCGHEH